MRSLIATLALSLIACSSGRALALQRDHLTPQEADHVRDAQRIDKRIEVFIKAIDRRIEALQGQPQNASEKGQKEIEEWGEVKGTRADLIADIAGILDEAITNLDDAAERPPQKEFLPKALEKMAEAAKRYVAALRPLREQISDRRERESLEQAIEMAEQIIAAHQSHNGK